jgi:DNA-binding CsgD family transcriptional regulator
MIKTEADLAKLTDRQREVLMALVRQMSKAEIARFSHIAERTTNFDAAALLHPCAIVQEVHSRLENSTA